MKRIYAIILFASFSLNSCEDVVDGLNNDPNNFTDTNLGLILNHSFLNVASIAESDPARLTGMFTDQFKGVDRQYGTLNGYSTGQATYDAIWEDFYQRGITQVQIAKQKAIEAGNTILEGQSLIIEAYHFGEAALLFGDVPFSQVNQVEDFPDPEYDDQIVILNAAIDMLDDGISKVGTSSAKNNVFTTSSTWEQVANGLKARYHLALKQYSFANEAAKAADFSSNANDWAIFHSAANFGENLFWQFEEEQRQDYLKVAEPKTDDEPAKFSYMLLLLDSDEPEYKGNSKTVESGRYSYYANGERINTVDGFAAQTASFPVLSFEEVQLIIAETELLNNDNSAALAALNLVRSNNAIRFSNTYDPYVISDFNPGGIANTGTLDVADALRREILLEKYCSVIGLPTFQDVNRTQNLIGVPIKNANTDVIPQRFLYPSTEDASNANAPDVIDQYIPTRVNE